MSTSASPYFGGANTHGVGSPRAVIGSLRVVVIQASGAIFEKGAKHRIRLSIGTQTHSTSLKKHPLGSSRKPLLWNETFNFAIHLPTDFLAISCARATPISAYSAITTTSPTAAPDVQVGALTIALAHLPQSSETTKWFELKNGGQSIAVLQLRLFYNLTYSIHRRDATSSLTIVPSQTAREFLRKELLRYARNNKITYRFIDYFLVIGCRNPIASSRNPVTILERYPLIDRSDFTVPAQLDSFCFPSGYRLRYNTHSHSSPPPPKCFSFRLSNQTDVDTDQIVAAVLCFWTKTKVPKSSGGILSSSNDADRDGSESPNHHGHDEEDDGPTAFSRSPSFSRSDIGGGQQQQDITPSRKSSNPNAGGGLPRSLSGGGGSGSRNNTLRPPELNSSLSSNSNTVPLTPSYRVRPANTPGSAAAFGSPITQQTDVNAAASNFKPSTSSTFSSPEASKSHSSPSLSAVAAPTRSSSSPDPSLEEDGLVTVYAPRCFVLLSRLSFVPVYKDILVTLYQHYCSEAGESMQQVEMEENTSNGNQATCPVCSSDSHSNEDGASNVCAVAAAALAHHQSTASHIQDVPSAVSYATNVEQAANTTTASNTGTSANTLASPSPQLAASASASSSPSLGATKHRMDISGMSSNLRAVDSSQNKHQPDISSLSCSPPLQATQSLQKSSSGSSLMPLTLGITGRGRKGSATSDLGVSEPASPITPTSPNANGKTLREKPKMNVERSAKASAPSSQQQQQQQPHQSVPSSPFRPYPALHTRSSTPSHTRNSSNSHSFCQSSCCPCSCCTIRVDCRGRTLEQYIIYLIDEIPLPLPGSAKNVEFEICCKKYRLALPASELDFPQLDFPLHVPANLIGTSMFSSLPQQQQQQQQHRLVQSHLGLLEILDLEVILLILRCILSEMKLIFHSSSISLLHSTTESLISLCFPFQWSHIYIPLLPHELYGMLEAPVSFIVGIEADGLGKVEEMLGVEGGRRGAVEKQNEDMRSQQTNGEVLSPTSSATAASSSPSLNSSSPHQSNAPHDLSSFVFIDLDHGTCDVSVPPPPFPPTAQRILIENIRKIVRPNVFGYDNIGGQQRQRKQKSSGDSIPTPLPPSHFGQSYHMHYHHVIGTDIDTAPGTTGSASASSHFTFPSSVSEHDHDTDSQSETDQARSDSMSTAVQHSPSPPTSATLQDLTPMSLNGPPTASSSSSPSESPFLTSSLTPSSDPSTLHSVLVSSSHPHDRALRIEFLQFLASLISNYRDYLFFVSGATPVFDTPSFLTYKSRNESLPFLSRFLETQIYRDFLDRHVEFPSYLQDYLLYINSHAEKLVEEDSAGAAFASPIVSLPIERVFRVALPDILQPQQLSGLVYNRTLHYTRLLNPSSSVASLTILLPPLYTSRQWSSQNMPYLGLLASGALAPSLPVKLRSRANSLNASRRTSLSQQQGGDSNSTDTTNVNGTPISPAVKPSITSPRTPQSYLRTPILPAPRVFNLASSLTSPIGILPPPDLTDSTSSTTALGKNPSTLNHTLLFSKMYDGLNSALAEASSASASASAAGTPRNSALLPGAAPDFSLTRDMVMRGGLVPIPMDVAAPQSFPSPSTKAMQPLTGFTPIDITAGVNPTPHHIVISSPSTSAAPFLASANSTTNSNRRPSATGFPSSSLSVSVPDVSATPTAVSTRTVTSTTSVASAHSTTNASTASIPPRRLRQMSLNLLSKSDFERSKWKSGERSETRLGQVLTALMKPFSITSASSSAASAAASSSHVDLGELSAVGELLALPEWRSNFVSFFHHDLGFSADHSDHTPHRLLSTSSFLSLSLLFNIALEECEIDEDYVIAAELLQFSGKIYSLPGIETIDTKSAVSTNIEREYLRSVTKRQRIWHNREFWAVAYRMDIKAKLENPSTPSTPSAKRNGFPTSATTPITPSPTSIGVFSAQQHALTEEGRESLLFELIAGMIYLQLSLGVDEELVRHGVAASCHEFHVSADKRQTLTVLVANIKKTTMMGSLQSDSSYTPQTTRRTQRKDESGLTLQYPADDDE